MSIGKYSPTVSSSYSFDQKWWERNGGGYGNGNNSDSDLDDDGYDSYGYSENGIGPDRAGNHEDDYLSGEWYPDEEYYHHPLYEDTSMEWSGRLLGDLPKFQQVQYQRLYLEYIKFDGFRYLFRGDTLYLHEDDIPDFTTLNTKWMS